MDIKRKMFLDRVVKNLRLPILEDFKFFDITDIEEKEYIIKQYFKYDDIVIKWCLHNLNIYMSVNKSCRIIPHPPYNLKIIKGDSLVYMERTNFWVKHDYDHNGNNILSTYSDGYWMESKYGEDNKEIWWKDTYNNDPVYCTT